MKSFRVILLATCLTALHCLTGDGLRPAFAEEPAKRVFIVHSYENGHICGQPQHDGAMKALEEKGWQVGKNLVIDAYFMDTKRHNNTKELIAEQAQKAQLAIQLFKPDIVLTIDDNAFRTIALPAAGKSGAYVFSGLNGQPEMYDRKKDFMEDRNHPRGNITGVYEKLYIREAIQVLSSMHEMKTVVFLGDQSPTGRAIAKQVEMEIMPNQNAPSLSSTIEQRTMESWEDFTQAIETINKDPEIGAFYLGTLLLRDTTGKTYTAPEIISYTVENAKKPAIGLNYAFIKLGLYGGATVDFYAMGHLAGDKIAQILNGEDIGRLPIEDAPRVALVFNLKRAETLDMTIPTDILMAADEVFRK